MKTAIIAATLVLAIPSAGSATQQTPRAGGTGAAPQGAAYQPYFDERWSVGGAPVTPAEVEAMLTRHTPQEVVGALYGTGQNSRWDTVASGIAKGDPAWLALAVRLSEGTDAGTSDDFAIAVGDALTQNPADTLRLLSRIPMGAGACEENGFEVPNAEARAFYHAALAKVAMVGDADLQPIKAQCLAQLRQGLAALTR